MQIPIYLSFSSYFSFHFDHFFVLEKEKHLKHNNLLLRWELTLTLVLKKDGGEGWVWQKRTWGREAGRYNKRTLPKAVSWACSNFSARLRHVICQPNRNSRYLKKISFGKENHRVLWFHYCILQCITKSKMAFKMVVRTSSGIIYMKKFTTVSITKWCVKRTNVGV